ncbi:squalene/phytoene synthase family protein [Aureispira]|nr:squalene/phytoene synthase family protein [Aureispira sp.]
MKALFDQVAVQASQSVTKIYSTSFFKSVSTLDSSIRDHIHAIYGMVRFADEIVDTFHQYNKAVLLSEFKADTYKAIERQISLNPILNSFQAVVNKYGIDLTLVDQFFYSMEMDLSSIEYNDELYQTYINGSAEVVGLMCLKVFVAGDDESYQELKFYASKLGSAFQKINFLRDLKDDWEGLGRIYFPEIVDKEFTIKQKQQIEKDIELDFQNAYIGVLKLPKTCRFSVYLAYTYYYKLFLKIKTKKVNELMSTRVRVPNYSKIFLYFRSYLAHSLNML